MALDRIAQYQWIMFSTKGRYCQVDGSVSFLEPTWRSKATGDVMRWITLIGAGLALLAGVVAADAQGIGYGPGVNPSNPQDLTHRSNPQDLLAPDGSNRQDLVRQPPSVNVPLHGRAAVTPSPALQSSTPALRHTVKTKPKQKARHRSSAARR